MRTNALNAALTRPEPIALMAEELRARGYRLEIEESDRVVSMSVENRVDDDPSVASREIPVGDNGYVSLAVDELIREAYRKMQDA